jgi:Tol biopolymer transport system component
MVVGVAAGGTVLLAGCEPVPPVPAVELVSTNAAGTASGNGPAIQPAFTADGTKVVYTSLASNLGPNDSNSTFDVYLRDLAAGTTTLVSVNAAGTDSGSGFGLSQSGDPTVSPDGTKVAFDSYAANFGPSDDDARRDVYVRDLTTGVTGLVSSFANVAGVTDESFSPIFSADGMTIVYERQTSGTQFQRHELYAYRVATGTNVLVSTGIPGMSPNSQDSINPALSPAGSKVAFASRHPNADYDVYVRDLTAATTTLVSHAATSPTAPGNGASIAPVFSPDGTKLAFASNATNLLPTPPRAFSNVYLADLTTGTTSLVSADATGAAADGTSSGTPVFSPDGTKLAFVSDASNLTPVPDLSSRDIFVRDLATGAVTLVTVTPDGSTSGNGTSARPVFAPDGTGIAFVSGATNLAPGGSGGNDLYFAELASGHVTRLASGVADMAGPPDALVVQPGGHRVAFVSRDAQGGANDTNHVEDVYLAAVRVADLSLAVDSPAEVPSGGEITYALDVTSSGPTVVPATADLLLPPGTALVDAVTTAGTCSPPAGLPPQPQVVSCSLGEVAPGDAVTITVRATVTADPGTTLDALAATSSPALDPTADNLVATHTTVS